MRRGAVGQIGDSREGVGSSIDLKGLHGLLLAGWCRLWGCGAGVPCGRVGAGRGDLTGATPMALLRHSRNQGVFKVRFVRL